MDSPSVTQSHVVMQSTMLCDHMGLVEQRIDCIDYGLASQTTLGLVTCLPKTTRRSPTFKLHRDESQGVNVLYVLFGIMYYYSIQFNSMIKVHFA